MKKINKSNPEFQRIKEQDEFGEKIPKLHPVFLVIAFIIFIIFIGYCAKVAMGDTATFWYVISSVALVVTSAALIMLSVISLSVSIWEGYKVRVGYTKKTSDILKKIKNGCLVGFASLLLFVLLEILIIR